MFIPKINNYYEITDSEIQYFLKIYFGINIRLKDIIPNYEIKELLVFKLEHSLLIPDIRDNIVDFYKLEKEHEYYLAIGKELKYLVNEMTNDRKIDYKMIILLLINCGIITHGNYIISITV